MAIQSSYAETIGTAREGMIANMNHCEVVTGEVETTGGVAFGLVVHQGTAKDQIDVGGAVGADPYPTTKYLGVTVRDRTRTPGDDKYIKGSNATVLLQGDIWVKVESAVSIGDDATFKTTTGAISSAALATTQGAIPRARFLTAAVANGLALLRVGTDQIGAA